MNLTTEEEISQLKPLDTNQFLDKYFKELEKDLKLTPNNISRKSLEVSAMRCKWLNYLSYEKENLKKLKQKKELHLKKKLSNKPNVISIVPIKSEDKLSENDEILQKINYMMDLVKENIENLERIQDIVKDFTWDIRNTQELLKLEHGM